MAMFRLKKGHEEHAEFQIPPSGIPTDQVIQMRRQGLSNNQIVQSLQRMGYKSHDIFDAMNQADIKGGVEGMQLDELGDIQNPLSQGGYGIPLEMQQQPTRSPMSMAPPPQQYPSMQASPPQQDLRHEIEEVAESIIDEKWEEFMENVKKLSEWKGQIEGRFVKIEQDISSLKERFEVLNKGVLGKIGEYDKNISEVGTEIKAMEKVFQKIMPTLSQNVNELSRITESMKKGK